MTALDYYTSLLEHSLTGDVYGSLMYGLGLVAVVCVVVSIVAAVER